MAFQAQSIPQVHDVIGIGFGPSNIALAIALQEQREAGHPVDAFFIEKQPEFAWHKDMLLDNSSMQISFLKDLATLRNPTSRFTFINYLHEKSRLQDFINLKTFFPSRQEFSDYFVWAASQFSHQCAYGEEVVEILPEKRGNLVPLLLVRTRNRAGLVRDRHARNIVISIGGTANIPAGFSTLQHDPRVFHSSSYLSSIRNNSAAKKIAIIGAGQSAAEIFLDMHGLPGSPSIDLIMRARSIKPSDDSPFVNQIFDSSFVDDLFPRAAAERAEILREYRHTNYAGPDVDLIEQIYRVFYQQKVVGEARHHLFKRHEIVEVNSDADGIHIDMTDLNTGQQITERYDAVVLATGYQRDQHRALLAPLAPYLRDLAVDRYYRVKSVPEFKPAIFLQGANEATHGLSDTLLSITAVRTGEIGDALLTAHAHALRPAHLLTAEEL
jgi:lysine/ornithine N-monooxygenase